jgi:4-amino-4-deoxy-L-arabinose transferase-like glycosyltransferase
MSLPRTRHFSPIFILLLAFAWRVWAIDRIPPGLSHDEAYNGVTAIQVLEGQRPIFFEINKGIEPLIIYLEALAFAAFGIGPVPMRLVNVACGMLTVALIYPLAVRLCNRRVALLAMAGVAISFWAIFTSRLALRAVTLPPLLLLTLYLYWYFLIKRSQFIRQGRSARLWRPFGTIHNLLFTLLTGLTAGATMYTYLSSRFVPLLLLAVFGVQLLHRQITRRHWLGLVIIFFIWAAIFAPLAAYFWEHQASFSERSSQVSTIPYALNGDFGPTLRHTGRTLGMFTCHGDETDRYNLDGRPIFDWVNGLFFYLGLALTLWRLRGPANQAGSAALLLLWTFFMLLPGFITDDSPHFLRTIGALPPTYIFWAVGLDHLTHYLSHLSPRLSRFRLPHLPSFILHHLPPLGRSSFILSLLLFTSLHTGYDYFGRWANAPGARTIYGADVAEAAQAIARAPAQELVVLSAEYYQDLDPFRFALHSRGSPPFVLWFDGRQSLAFPPAASQLDPLYIFLASAPPAEAWQPFFQPAQFEPGRSYTAHRVAVAAARQQLWAATFPLENRLNITVNNEVIISAYRLLGQVVSGGKFNVLLGWQALRTLPPGADYTFLVKLNDQQGHLWSQADGNGFAPSNWQPGVQGLQLLTLRLPGDLPPRTYQLTLAVVDRHSGQALPDATGSSLINLGAVPGRLAATPRTIDPARLPNPLPLPAQSAELNLALRGFQLHQVEQLLQVTLHWQVLQQLGQDERLKFRLLDSQNQPIFEWPAIAPINGEWPTSQWPAGYWVQDRVDLPLGPEIPAGAYRLQLTWSGQANSTQPVFDLGLFSLTP